MTARRLTKREVEELLARYDDDPTTALATALAAVLDRPAGTPWDDLLPALPVDDERRAALARRDVDALDALARELNERRGV